MAVYLSGSKKTTRNPLECAKMLSISRTKKLTNSIVCTKLKILYLGPLSLLWIGGFSPELYFFYKTEDLYEISV
jgi:hypothetical protein